ncbi:MAG: hypothetical protein ACEQSB_00560 [Undibacterium sp.]
MRTVSIAGLDGAKANFGIARMTLNIDTMKLALNELTLIETEKDASKQVRKSSDNLRRSKELHEGIIPAIQDCTVVFAEVPSGGQSADAVLAFGIVIGLYASLPVPLIEVTPSETKMAAVGTKTASKQEMIEWGFENYPDGNWKTTKRGGLIVPTLKNEHLADAVAIVHAGIKTKQFQQTIAMMRSALTLAA